MKVQKLTRTEAESNLEFAGFIIFENKLKGTTTEVISELNQAGIRDGWSQ
jgi:cation-transporting ATPase 13A3/4/5